MKQLIKILFFKCFFLTLVMGLPFRSETRAQSLKFASINFWSGLDYSGSWSMGEYESPATRQRRLDILISELKELQPDVIALQELNPVSSVTRQIATALGYDYFFQRVNAGIKMMSLGLPLNLSEGIALLAKKDLHLEFVDVWDLSQTFGAFGDIVSFHFEDHNAALIGRIFVDGKEVYVVNVHLSAAVPIDSLSRRKLKEIAGERYEVLLKQIEEAGALREIEVNRLLDRIDQKLPGTLIVVVGDFNATRDSPEIQSLLSRNFVDAVAVGGKEDHPTWDAERNANVHFSQQATTARGEPLDEVGLLSAWYDHHSRSIDYIFLNKDFTSGDVVSASIFLNHPVDGLFASDHYGVIAKVEFSHLMESRSGTNIASSIRERILEPLPIITYDTDVGFGYGVKAFFLNHARAAESFDVILFNSTKGERWYRFVFSLPDFELRQGKVYDLSLDVVVDYDKYLKNNFFGIGNHSRVDAQETYTKEPLEISGIVSRGFSRRFVGQIGLKYKTVRNLNYAPDGLFAGSLQSINRGRSSHLSFVASARYDSRNSFINPSNGMVVQADLEVGRKSLASDYNISSFALSVQEYSVLFYPKTVMALRGMGQVVGGSVLPIHVLASLGGNRTLRGYPQDRFLDRMMLLWNAEIRFPIIWRFEGVAFYDVGKVWERPSKIELSSPWANNIGFGLRVVLETFIVRADLGISREGKGFYFNFGHVF